MVLPAFVAGGVEFVDALIAVAGNQDVAVGQAQWRGWDCGRSSPSRLCRPCRSLALLPPAAEGDKVMAVAQPFDAAPGEAGC